MRERLETGQITDSQMRQLEHWIDHGYLVIERAVPEDVIDEISGDVERAWRGELPSLWIEHWEGDRTNVSPVQPEFRDLPHKLLDLYVESAASRAAIFSEPILEFLVLLFERPAMAFQSLCFMRGTGQPIHQDSAYVVVSSPLEFAATWIALEDIQPGTGELEYYDGSHRMKDFLFQGRHKNMPEGDPDHQHFLDSLHGQAREMNLERKQFRPRKGDALIWSADLAHGGSPNITPGSTRRSLVTHYCPKDLDPGYFRSQKHSGRVRYRDDAYYVHPLRG
jgi:hypothetical protein